MDLTRVDWAACADNRREMWVAWRSEHEGAYVPTVHANCPCNEVAALGLRSFGQMPAPVYAKSVGVNVKRAFRDLRNVARRYTGVVMSRGDVVDSYDGAMRRRYAEAERSLRVEGPLDWKDYLLAPFLKAEKPRVAHKLPKPRLIYPRSPRYNLEVATRLKPLEHWLWGRLTLKALGVAPNNTRLVAKGLNPRQRANLIVRKFNAIKSCVCFEVDGSAFEAHIGLAQLKEEHAVYKAAFPGDRKLARLLRVQEVLRGRLPCGAKFSREGARASGDVNTGMGNTLIMLAVVVGVLRDLKVTFDVLVDGDNALVFLPSECVSRVLGVFAQQVLSETGHEFVLERPVDYIEGIRFGGSAPVYLGPRLGWSMVREWGRVLSCAFASHRWLREPRFAREWIAGVARCELSLARGVPVLQEWALGGLRASGHLGRVRAHPHRDYFVQGAWLAGEESRVEVHQEARLSFERAFGLSSDAQLLIEATCRRMQMPDLDPGAYSRCLVTSFAQWMDESGVHELWLDAHC